MDPEKAFLDPEKDKIFPMEEIFMRLQRIEVLNQEQFSDLRPGDIFRFSFRHVKNSIRNADYIYLVLSKELVTRLKPSFRIPIIKDKYNFDKFEAYKPAYNIEILRPIDD